MPKRARFAGRHQGRARCRLVVKAKISALYREQISAAEKGEYLLSHATHVPDKKFAP